MALDPQLLEILACPEDKGPLLLLRRRGRLYNPRLHRRYVIREASRSCSSTRPRPSTTPEHARLMAKVDADGLALTVTPSESAVTVPERSTRSGCGASRSAWPSSWTAAWPSRRRHRRSPVRRRPRPRRRARHGRQRHRRRRAWRRWPSRRPGPGRRREGLRAARLRRSRHAGARACRARAAPRRPWRRPPRRWHAGAPVVAVSAGGAAGRPGRTLGRRRPSRWPATSRCPGRRSARVGAAARGARGGRAVRRVPGSRRRTPWHQLRRRATARPRGRRTWPRSWPAGSGGPARSSTAAARRARWRPRAGRASSTRTPRRRRSPTCVPELVPQRAAGWGQHGDVTRQVLTLIQLRHDFEHPQVARRFELMDEQMLEVVSDICVVEAEGTGRWPSFRPGPVGDLMSLHLAEEAGVDPAPFPRSRARRRACTPDER